MCVPMISLLDYFQIINVLSELWAQLLALQEQLTSLLVICMENKLAVHETELAIDTLQVKRGGAGSSRRRGG